MILGYPSVTATSTATRSAVIASRGVAVCCGRSFTSDIASFLFSVIVVRRRLGREHAAIRLQIDQRRLVETIQTTHQHRAALQRDETHRGDADRIRSEEHT